MPWTIKIVSNLWVSTRQLHPRGFVSTGLFPPAEMDSVPRTIFDDDQTEHFSDQIAWFSTPNDISFLTSLTYTRRGGHFDFVPHAYQNLTKNQLSRRISDHYPLWVEFDIQPA